MISDGDREKIKIGIENGVNSILNNTNELAEAREVKTAVDWYGRTKEGAVEPGQIVGVINRLVLEKVSDKLASDLSNKLQEALGDLTIQKNKGGISLHRSLLTYEISVDVVLVVNGTTDLSIVTIDLELDVDFDASDMRALANGKSFEIGNIVFTVSLSLVLEMMIGSKSKEIGKQEFELKDILLRFPQRIL